MHIFMPMFAEIADKMPKLDVVWERSILIGLLIALLTAGLSLIRFWVGGVVVGIFVALGLLAALPDSIMDSGIVQELGAGYLFQQRISGFVPFVLAAAAWLIVWLRRRPNQSD